MQIYPDPFWVNVISSSKWNAIKTLRFQYSARNVEMKIGCYRQRHAFESLNTSELCIVSNCHIQLTHLYLMLSCYPFIDNRKWTSTLNGIFWIHMMISLQINSWKRPTVHLSKMSEIRFFDKRNENCVGIAFFQPIGAIYRRLKAQMG